MSPLASILYRGRGVTAISCAIAIARARASFAFLLSERSAEYSRWASVTRADFLATASAGRTLAPRSPATASAEMRKPCRFITILGILTDNLIRRPRNSEASHV